MKKGAWRQVRVMAARSHSRGVVTRGRSRPNISWSSFVNSSESVVAASTKVLLGSFTLTAEGIDETQLRTRGMLSVRSDQIAASEAQLGAFGMIVVTDIALAAGAASIPGPGTDASDDGWFVWIPIVQFLQVASGVGFDPLMGTRYEIDSKAKRIIEGGKTVALMVENVHATHAFAITVALRVLSQVRGTR